ncbi:MAG: VOC family protein [Gammaproteobacteria bacterium]|nr:VOC family protein [Gammaproteobacteria bacterium]
MVNKNTICLWYDNDAEAAARFYAETFPDSAIGAVHRAPSDFPGGKKGNVLTVEFTVCGVPCIGLNGGPIFPQSEAFSFQIATDDQAETDRYWNAIVGNGGAASACGWCKDKWGLNWQITPRVLTTAMSKGGDVAKRAFEAMMTTDGEHSIFEATTIIEYLETLRDEIRPACRPGPRRGPSMAWILE